MAFGIDPGMCMHRSVPFASDRLDPPDMRARVSKGIRLRILYVRSSELFACSYRICNAILYQIEERVVVVKPAWFGDVQYFMLAARSRQILSLDRFSFRIRSLHCHQANVTVSTVELNHFHTIINSMDIDRVDY